jgi:hypothetical protein
MTSATNLVVGIALILLGLGGMALVFSNDFVGANLFWGVCFILVFVFMGGYETGKYIEMRHEQRAQH